MTPEQTQLFCKIASMGVACGLEHRYEWLANYMMHYLMAIPYEEVLKARADAIDAFLALEKTTASCPEEETELAALDELGLSHKISAYYTNARKRHNKENNTEAC